ncbi:3-dehydroquinate synthase [Pleurocapsa sp. CCALA 161]|uniref:sedoheptulose 7-phosphate cyclase n=1 Tax=Pleurocapsa sp. CCALA 161 TaxID=2107688 RepID=UPI000D05994D|nr:sedoheptulose 7-phosphate cyclase [Pleurocapsa sp. CCALA 161]PSB09991.1 3-dehydroquinate synthase [Pleurocapsa sp. CCALA 161]
MTKTTSAVKAFISKQNCEPLAYQNVERAVEAICCSEQFRSLLLSLIDSPAFSQELGREFAQVDAVKGISACRKLRTCLNLSFSNFFGVLAELLAAFDEAKAQDWYEFANKIHSSELGTIKLIDYLKNSAEGKFYQDLAERLVRENPHAIYPTSSYRESRGYVESTPDDQTIEAVMRSSTFTSIKVVDNSLDPEQLLLRDMYISHGRCVCLVDQNVDGYFGEQLEHYFDYHGIQLDKLVYRAMEVDKGIYTVEKMLGDFKNLGVSRNEPVLIVGGGVLADTGGLACALYHRNTPYIMLSTSIVAGIDAGPSPRTCCDGFGYKNLFGAYHPPILSITDRYFFKTLKEGWLRHGIIEIIKMAVTKDAQLFEMMEQAGPRLIETRFGTVDADADAEINLLSQKILGAALRSYVAAEYDNLYETHQCRPHAYGHTWSPGFEIEAGLLHGHAVSIGMGFGAYLSLRLNWIDEAQFQRIMRLISSFGLSLWHDIMYRTDTLWASQQKIFEKRGGNLAAPLPKGEIGQCGYLNYLTRAELDRAVAEYRLICLEYPRKGLGIEPHCSDVGLEDPSTVAHAPLESIGINSQPLSAV